MRKIKGLSTKKIAYIVVGWNNKVLLKDCLQSIINQTHEQKYIVYVDNSSTDSSVKYVQKVFPEVHVIENESNMGFAKGNNIGIDYALKDPNVELIALINTDARIDPLWSETIANFTERKPKGALFQGTTLDYYDHQIIDSTHIFVARNGQGTQGNWRYFVTDELGPKKIFGVNAAACIITRRFIEAQPFPVLFDETMFMYLEDVDLAARATIMGWDNYLVPNARAYHMGSATSGKNPGFSLYMTFRNNSGMLVKNFPLRLLVRMLPDLIRGDIDTIRVLRRMGKREAARTVIKGRFIGLLRIPLFLPKRQTLKRYRDVSTVYLWNIMRAGY